MCAVGGRPRNTERDIKILELWRSGLSAIKIARLLGIHRNSVYDLLGRIDNLSNDGHVGEFLKKLKAMRAELFEREEEDARRLEETRLMRKRIETDEQQARLQFLLKSMEDVLKRIKLIKKLAETSKQFKFSAEISAIAEALEIKLKGDNHVK
jgi:DNA-binding CsgD family transcriptional regulator